MAIIRTLHEAPTLDHFLREIQQYEESTRRFKVSAYDLKLYADGTLGVRAKGLYGRFAVSSKAIPSLARLAKIPVPFFQECDLRLRSVLFNYLVRQKVLGKEPLCLSLRGQEAVKIQNCNLLFAPRYEVLDTISKTTPKGMQPEDLKVITYDWNGEFDVSIIAPALSCEPRKDDIVAFGVNVSQSRDGAVQVQATAFRLSCSNGAVNRICDGRHHRIRRLVNRPERQRDFLRRIVLFTEEAWGQWSHQAEELARLNNSLMEQDDFSALRSRLRQAPFFLSLRVVKQVLERLEIEASQHQGGPTLYDLWNAMTFLGTHQRRLSRTYRTRLRFGAGEFTRHESRVCSACRQLVLS